MNISLNMAVLMNQSFWRSFHWKGRYLIEHGGAGSGKSYFIVEKLLWRILTEPNHNIAIFRKVARTLRLSCFKLVQDVISDWNLSAQFHVHKSEMTITFMENGNQIWFIGLDDQEKLKSIAGITSAWMEEGSEFTYLDFEQVDLRMRGKNDTYFQLIISYNPISQKLWIKGTFHDSEQHGKTLVNKTTYKDNPYNGEDYDEKLERLEGHLRTVYTLGDWGVLRGLIYNSPTMIPLSEYPSKFDVEAIGVDWGYNNPMALLHVGFRDQKAYVRELFYESEYTTDELIEQLPELGVGKTIELICDSAEPDRIEMLSRAGYNAHPCHKGAGSVKAGIDCMQSYEIFSCEENVNFNEEVSEYRWKEDRDGKPLDVPNEGDDHLMDGGRYAIFRMMGEHVPEFRMY